MDRLNIILELNIATIFGTKILAHVLCVAWKLLTTWTANVFRKIGTRQFDRWSLGYKR